MSQDSNPGHVAPEPVLFPTCCTALCRSLELLWPAGTKKEQPARQWPHRGRQSEGCLVRAPDPAVPAVDQPWCSWFEEGFSHLNCLRDRLMDPNEAEVTEPLALVRHGDHIMTEAQRGEYAYANVSGGDWD